MDDTSYTLFRAWGPPGRPRQSHKLRNRALITDYRKGFCIEELLLGHYYNALTQRAHTSVCGITWAHEHELHKFMSFQKHAPLTTHSKNNLILVYAAWNFSEMVVDIVGPFSQGAGHVKYLIMAVYYFRKLAEAKPVAAFTVGSKKKFLWDNIICRFGIPLYFVIERRWGKIYRPQIHEWCQEFQVRQKLTSVAHHQGNGKVEFMNRTIIDGLKKRIEEAGASWVDELPSVWKKQAHHEKLHSV